MRIRIVASVISVALFVTFLLVVQPYTYLIRDQAAVQQFSNDPQVLANAQRQMADYPFYALAIGLLVFLALLWIKPFWQWIRKHQQAPKALIALAGAAMLMTGCGYKSDIVTIETNQTAFLVPVAGETSSQTTFQSAAYLKAKQLAAKQVEIPYEWKQTGTTFGIFATGDWYPSVKLYLVDRTLQTREWTTDATTGTSPSDQSFRVESSESVDFTIGATCTAYITEDDAAQFLYIYGSKSLSDVMDTVIRGEIQRELYNEFSSRTLAHGQADQTLIFQTISDNITKLFKEQGISIQTFGGQGGMTYTDPNVQAAVNKSYAAQQSIIQAQAQATQQGFDNQRLVNQANAQATATVIAGQAAAEVMNQQGKALAANPNLPSYEGILKWNGVMPQVVGGNGALPFINVGQNNPIVTPTAAP